MGASFQKHGAVARTFLALVDGEIHRLKTWLMRWKCVACGTTFRHYPPGVAPRKHYLPASLLGLCQRYAQEEQATYRQVVKTQGQPLRYAGVAAEADWPESRKEHEETRVLAHSTLWQWLGFLAALWALARQRGERRQSTADKCDLLPWAIHPGKYRSAEREQILIQAASTLAVLAGEKYSTDFKTLSSGP